MSSIGTNGYHMSSKNKFPPTAEQQAALNAALEGHSLKLIALAGSGKTSTLVLIAHALCQQPNRYGSRKVGKYLAFNKDIAKEAKQKMPVGVHACTFHSLALSQCPAWMKNKLKGQAFHPKDFIAHYNLKDFSVRTFSSPAPGAPKKNGKTKVSGFFQKRIIDAGLDKYMSTAAKYPAERHIAEAVRELLPDVIEEDQKNIVLRLFPLAEILWNRYTNEFDELGIGNNHNVYLKYWANSEPIIDADFILFDEAQDADPIMLGVLLKQPSHVQVIYVGDPHQQIYSWRGAINVMQALPLPSYYLTQSFRFGDNLAKTCQPILNRLGEANTFRGLPDTETLVDGSNKLPKDIDAVLCRTNLGALECLLEYEKHGLKAQPQNINVKECLDMINNLHEFSLGRRPLKHPLLSSFKSYSELQQYCEDYPGDQAIVPFVKILEQYDYDIISSALTRCQLSKIDDFQSSDGNEFDLIVTTAHRSKGCEWDRVMVHGDFLDHFFDSGSSDKKRKSTTKEEYRLLYVTLTRARKKLYVARLDWLLKELGDINLTVKDGDADKSKDNQNSMGESA